jgi:predicted O-linked N-acetylglucosamine transferase (SPINDLY family)
MPRKIKQYTNPFLKAKGPLVATGSSTLTGFQLAVGLHQQGHLSQAESIYRQLLDIEPRHSDALHLLGVIGYQTGNYQAAVDMIGQAIEINPNQASYYSNFGLSLHELKQFEAALASYDKAIALKPDYAEAYSNHGLSLYELKKFEAALVSYDKAIALKPDYAEAYSNRGLAHKELSQFESAVTDYDKAISLNPDSAEAFSNRGVALKDLKQLDAAIASFDIAIALKPDYAEAYSNRGIAHLELNQLEAAAANLDKAITLKPNLAEAYLNLGVVQRKLKQLDAAITSYDKAIALNPDYAEAYSNRGVALKELNQLDAAVASYDLAIALKPDLAEAYANRGAALQDLKQLVNAIASYDMALALKPDFDYLFGMRLHLKMHLCDWQEFEHNVSELRLKIQRNAKASSCFDVLALPIGIGEQRQSAEIWNSDKNPHNQSLCPILKYARKPKIRIGYFSADFYNHATTYLIAELFERHNKSKFELIAFSFGPDKKDEMRSRVSNAFDQFIDVVAMSDKSIAQLSRELEIDIAVDLKGLTQDTRLGIFSYNAAPIQVSYLGYPGTLGADYIDYLIADKTLVPHESQKQYSEKIVYLPNSYQVNDRQRVIASKHFTKQELGLRQEDFVFCCFNNNYKITPGVFDSWARILKAVNASVLWLLEDNPAAAINLQKEAALRGVDPTRLVFAKRMDLPEHLARHKAADLFLDTLPYNAHTTASDALWAGLPVLTCTGESFASRVAASLLNAIGLPELVTQTQGQYELLAIELATNPDKLKNIKAKLERNRMTTPLFDTQLFTKHLEEAYTNMYERYQADLEPEHFYIDA